MPDVDDDEPDAADESLLAALGEALGPDPAPTGLSDRARALLTFADTDAELVLLLGEGDTDLAVAGVRGDASGAPRVYSSEDGTLTVELELDDTTVQGLVLGADVDTVTLEMVGRPPVDTPVGPHGRFRVTAPAQGPARLRVGGATAPFCTEWFVI